MAGRKVSNAVAVALVALLVVATAAGTAGVCNVDQAAMEACRPYCAVGSTESKPSDECCAGASHADFGCFCRLRGVLRSMGNIDGNRAMQIPSKCGIHGAPTSC